jgi:hypothetical protein
LDTDVKIKASIGNAPKSASLDEEVYSIHLTAQEFTEKVWLAGLLKALLDLDPRGCRSESVPRVTVSTVKR